MHRVWDFLQMFFHHAINAQKKVDLGYHEDAHRNGSLSRVVRFDLFIPWLCVLDYITIN